MVLRQSSLLCRVVALSFLLLPAHISESSGLRDNPDFLSQISTVGNMRQLVVSIGVFRELEGAPPAGLEELFAHREIFRDAERASAFGVDGWGRDFYYYTNGRDYLLISFGRNGLPDQQVSCPGCVMEGADYDSDIVWLSEGWAQSPVGVDR